MNFSELLNNLEMATKPIHLTYTSNGFVDCERGIVIENSRDNSEDKRLHHSTKWCIENQCNHTYDSVLFIEGNKDVLSREIKIIYHHVDSVKIILNIPLPYNSTLFKSTFNERILQSMSDAVLLTEADVLSEPGPRIIYCNSAYTEMCGYSLKEVIGSTPRMLQGQDTTEISKRNIRMALDRWEPVKQRVINYKKDGSKFVVDLDINPIQDETGWYTHWLSVQRDVTSQLAHQEHIRQSEFILQSNKIGCWHYHPDDNHCYFDSIMLELHNTTMQIFDNKLLSWCNMVVRDDQNAFSEQLIKSLLNQTPLMIEYRVDISPTEVRYLRLYSRPIIDLKTNSNMLTGICFDYTKEVIAERDLDEHKRLIEEKTKLASIGQLAAGVGHEINNPLSVITASTDLLQAQLSSFSEVHEIINPTIERITVASERIAKIVDGLRSASTINREVTKHEPLNLITASADTLEMVSEFFEGDRIHLKVNRHKDLDFFWINGTHSGYQQILVNLLNNARDAVVSQDYKLVEIRFHENNDECGFDIIDNGIGISDEIKHKLFQPFVTSKPIGKGTGLGLSITHSIVRSFGGEITHHSSEQSKTVFSVRFPKIRKPCLKFSNTNSKSTQTLRHLDVLITEDEKDVGDSVESLLTLSNCHTERAENGNEALIKIKDRKFDLILIDLKMPEKNGWELLEEIRLYSLAPDSKIYVMTGEIISQTDRDFKKLAFLADGLIQKPINRKRLDEILFSV